jgi:hypothetical protein
MWASALGAAALIFSAVALGGAALAPTASSDPPSGGPARLAVVELFTSQGCSSCPPANANVAALSRRPDVLALSFGVTYWDYLGWKDTFARPEFTERQRAYERSLGRAGPFTPQVVVDGNADVVGQNLGEIDRLIARETLAGGPEIAVSGGRLSLGAGRAPKGGADVWLVRYDRRTVEVPIVRGENGGRTLPHKNVVRSLVRLGRWSGAPERLSLPREEAGLASAVLVQVASGGPILSAVRL